MVRLRLGLMLWLGLYNDSFDRSKIIIGVSSKD